MTWYDIYSPRKNQDIIEKLFKKFKIEKYNFINDGYGDFDILIEYGLYTYKLELHEEKKALYIYRKSTFRAGQKSSKEYHTPYCKIKNDVWYNACKTIVKNK